MVELAVECVVAMNLVGRQVGILASPAIRQIQVFDHAFASHKIGTLYPSNQDLMLDVIRSLKIDSSDAAARQVMEEAAHELIGNGVGCLLVACSELSIITDAVPSFFPCLDTIDILAEAIIEFAGADLRNNFPRNALRQKIT
jgi:aspartate racemase